MKMLKINNVQSRMKVFVQQNYLKIRINSVNVTLTCIIYGHTAFGFKLKQVMKVMLSWSKVFANHPHMKVRRHKIGSGSNDLHKSELLFLAQAKRNILHEESRGIRRWNKHLLTYFQRKPSKDYSKKDRFLTKNSSDSLKTNMKSYTKL